MTMSTALREAPAHPLSGRIMSGADMIVQVLADEGVDTIFGYSGGAILPTYDAVFRYNQENALNGVEPMPLIVPANEQGAGFMAAGYARASGKVGCVLVTSGPGATNTVTPVRDCMADSIPIVVICGQVPTAAIGTDAFQEAPVTAVMGPVAKHVFLVTRPEQLEATMRTAFEIARTGRPGPVVVDVPKDVQNWTGPFRGGGTPAHPGIPASPRCSARAQARRARVPRVLRNAGGKPPPAHLCRWRGGECQRLGFAAAARRGVRHPRSDHPDGAGWLRHHRASVPAHARDARHRLRQLRGGRLRSAHRDGSAFRRSRGGVATSEFAPKARRVLHFDIDPSEIDKVKPADWHYTGKLTDALDALTAYGRSIDFSSDFSEWHAEVAALKRDYALNYDRASPLIQPQYVMEVMNRITGGDAIITTGVGQHQMWAAQYCDFSEPRLWLTSGSMGTMGFGLPAALGAQFARPNKLVVDVDGDASIRMNLGEFETATSYDLPVKVMVLNNFGDGMVMQWQRLYFKGRLSASDKSLRKKDFVLSAKADGFEYAKRLDRKEDVPSVLEEFLSYPGPAFLEVVIDPEANVYPMVGPGLSYQDMITGDFIPNRYEDRGAEPDPADLF